MNTINKVKAANFSFCPIALTEASAGALTLIPTEQVVGTRKSDRHDIMLSSLFVLIILFLFLFIFIIFILIR